MPLFDSHAHFAPPPEETAADVLARAAAAGVTGVLAVGGDSAANEGARAAAQCGAAAVSVRLAWGFDCAQSAPDAGDWAALAAARPLLSAIGEIALDATRSAVPQEIQIETLRRQLELAREWDLPVSLHTRGADAETLAALDSVQPRTGGLRGSVHCFTGGTGFERALLDRGFCIGISGIVSFNRGANVREAAAYCPAGRLLVETDSPFLAPVPLRGSRNEPANVALVAAAVARARGEPAELVAETSARNAESLFPPAPRPAAPHLPATA